MCSENNLTEVPNSGNHNCFGCSPGNECGLRMKFYTDQKSVFSWVTVPPHLSGWSNLVHGGVLSTILDEIMSWTAIHLLKKFILTKSMTVDFLKPVFVGQQLEVQGNVADTGRKREAFMEGYIYNEDKKLCVKANGTFALFSPESVRRMGILGEQALKDFDELLNG